MDLSILVAVGFVDVMTFSISANISPLVHQHAARYTERLDQPFAVSWARDTKIYKRLVKVYVESSVEEWQAQYLAQVLDSWSGRCGFSILFRSLPWKSATRRKKPVSDRS